MPNLTIHVPANAVTDLVAAVANREHVPVPPTTPEQLALVTQYTQHQLQSITADYRGQHAASNANDATMGEDWTTG